MTLLFRLLMQRTSPGDVMEILHHVTHNRIDCGLWPIHAKVRDDCQTMVNYA